MEILLIDADSETTRSLNDYYEEIYNGANADTTIVTGEDGFTSVDSSSEKAASMIPEIGPEADQPQAALDQQPPADGAPE